MAYKIDILKPHAQLLHFTSIDTIEPHAMNAKLALNRTKFNGSMLWIR